jgi:16S rRNA (adenine1518-N6/adenine1519-N6)-dimethyltransferase
VHNIFVSQAFQLFRKPLQPLLLNHTKFTKMFCTHYICKYMIYTIKKSLGQHFLHNENICKTIVDHTLQCNQPNIVEVGPGGGAITKYFLDTSDINFKAIEFDTEKVVYLKTTYPKIEGKIYNEDFLKANKPFDNNFMVVGNFPYNISSQILFKVLDWKDNVDCVIGMFQKEVAQRIASKHNCKDYGILSVLVQAFYTVEYLFDVPPQSFTPAPKVMSGVIKLTKNKTNFNMLSEHKFFILVKVAFGQRRKMLRNPLKPLFDTEVLKEDIFSKRAEQLSVEDFANLTFKMK